MEEIAVGRKEILKLLDISTWRTIQLWRKSDPGFEKIIRHHPVSNRPFIVIAELHRWMIECDNINRAKKVKTTKSYNFSKNSTI